MDHQDPQDFNEVEDALRGARPTLSPIEADELQQRIARRVAPAGKKQGRFARLRRSGVAVALTSGNPVIVCCDGRAT